MNMIIVIQFFILFTLTFLGVPLLIITAIRSIIKEYALSVTKIMFHIALIALFVLIVIYLWQEQLEANDTLIMTILKYNLSGLLYLIILRTLDPKSFDQRAKYINENLLQRDKVTEPLVKREESYMVTETVNLNEYVRINGDENTAKLLKQLADNHDFCIEFINILELKRLISHVTNTKKLNCQPELSHDAFNSIRRNLLDHIESIEKDKWII